MNADLLLAHFDNISDAPDAITRLRQFVLSLAVRGKLVKSDPAEEPAHRLLKRIQKQRALMVERGEIKRCETLPVEPGDEPFLIPPHWVWTRMGEIADWGSGSTPARGNSDHFGGGITWLKSGELNDNKQLKGSEETISELALRRGSFRLNHAGDVLIAMYGATIGKVAILAEPAVTNQAVCGCTPMDGVSNEYLFVFLKSQRAQFQAAREGGAQPNISKIKILSFAFALPPLAEQYRIVAKVEELMALCDRLEAAQRERESRRDLLAASAHHHLNNGSDAKALRGHAQFFISHLPRITARPDQIKHLRQTVLSLGIRGKLVEQDPKDEPAFQLMARINSEKSRLLRLGELTKSNKAVARERSFQPLDLPSTWIAATLGEIAFDFRYGTSVKCCYETVGEPVLRIPNIDNGRISTADLKFGSLSPREAEELRLRIGDILMVRSNGSLDLVGRPAMVEAETVGYCYAGYLVRVRTSTELLNTKYLVLALNSGFVRDQIEVPVRTTVGLKNVNTAELSSLVIPVPPLAEQHRIVAKVDQLMILCNQLEAGLTRAQTDASRLLDSVLHHALNRLPSSSLKHLVSQHLRGQNSHGSTGP